MRIIFLEKLVSQDPSQLVEIYKFVLCGISSALTRNIPFVLIRESRIVSSGLEPLAQPRVDRDCSFGPGVQYL